MKSNLFLMGLLVSSFYLGKFHERRAIQNQPYVLIQEEAWKLKMPSGIHAINIYDQVGDIYHRMNGLLYEKNDDLQVTLELIKNQRGY